MQVSCNHCGARYEFEAAAIPAAGYDAQCTTCNGVFFVSPQAEVPSSQVSVACSHCGAVYQFAVSEIPPSGYDAQCTQCQAVFFVGPQTIQTVGTEAANAALNHASAEMAYQVAEPVDDIPEVDAADFSSESEVMRNPLMSSDLDDGVTRPIVVPARVSAEPAVVPMTPAQPAVQTAEQRGFTPQALHRGTMEIDLAEVEPEPDEPELAHEVEPIPVPAAKPRGARSEEFSDVMAINAELGEPLGQPPSHLTADEEVEGIRDRRTQRWMLALTGIFALVALAGLLYLVAPRAFDMSIGRLVGIKRTVDPAAVPFLEKGVAAMLEDTDEAYANAIKEFTQALKVDPLYPDALALGAVAQAWRGSDLQTQGAELVATAFHEQAHVRGYQELPAAVRTPQVTSKLAELQHAARTHREAGTDMLETGGRYISDGMEWLLRGRRQFPKSPLVAEAEAICYTTDPDGLARADKALAHSLELRYGANAPSQAGGPPDAWVPFVQGSIHAAEKGGTEQAEELWLTALKEEPKFQRTRWLLARLYARTGQREAAKHVLDDILTAIPAHAKAKLLLATLVAPSPSPAPEGGPVVVPLQSPEGESQHGKGKAKHAKHH